MEKKNDRKKEFLSNTFILLLGKFTTQFMSILLLPLYTRYLITSEYGMVDLLQTYVSLLIPIFTVKLDSAIFRFLLEKRKDESGKTTIISSTFFIMILSVLITSIILIIVNIFFSINYFKYFSINLIVLMLSSIILQVLRGLGKTKEYSIASVISGFSVLIINIFMILVMKSGAESIFISSTIANIICILYVAYVSKLHKYIKIKSIDKKLIIEMLKYSFPMVTNSLSWWIVNASDRTIISIVIGAAYNGIYTISCKFSNILNSIYNIINMSWQETASLHIEDEDKDEFFTSMINNIFMIFASVSILILAFLPPMYDIVVGSDYLSSYNYIPILLYANLWNVLINLIGGIYIAKKRTKEISNTTIISSIINIVINLILIKKLKLYAACISTLISYFVMAVYRCKDCQKYVKVKLKIKTFIIYTVIFVISSYLYYINNLTLNIFNCIMVMIYVVIINKNYIIKLYNKFILKK